MDIHVSKGVSLWFVVAGCEMFGFPHVEGDVTQPKDVRHVGGQVLLLSLTGVRNHRTARQNQRVRQNYFNRRSCIINITPRK